MWKESRSAKCGSYRWDLHNKQNSYWSFAFSWIDYHKLQLYFTFTAILCTVTFIYSFFKYWNYNITTLFLLPFPSSDTGIHPSLPFFQIHSLFLNNYDCKHLLWELNVNMCMGVFILYASLCAIIGQNRREAPGTEVTVGYALLSGCWKLNPGQIK